MKGRLLIFAACLLCSGCADYSEPWTQQLVALQALGAGVDATPQGTITFINLSRSPAVDQDLACLGSFESLEQLWLYDTRTTDLGLKHLRDLTRLRVLVLGKTEITDRGLNELAHLTSLRELYLYPADVSDLAVKRLQDALPGTLIIY